MNKKINRKRPMRESKVTGNWYGIPDIKFVWHNTQSDPGLIYDGKYFNSYDVEDALIVDYREYCEENGIEDRNDDGFDEWVRNNDYLVYEYLDNLIESGAYEEIEEISSFGPFPAGYRRGRDFIYGESLDKSLAWNKTEERIIDKLNTLTNADTFWDDVKRFTKNLHSDRAIRSWEWLSEKRYNELCGIEDVDESLKRNSVKENSMKLKIREVRHAELSPSYDSRKSFYGKAHVVTDDDGTEILYSYDTPVVEIKNGEVKLLAQWDSSQTTLRHVKEFLQQNGFKVGSKAQIANMYGTAVESVRRPLNKKTVKESNVNGYFYKVYDGYMYPTCIYTSEIFDSREEAEENAEDIRRIEPNKEVVVYSEEEYPSKVPANAEDFLIDDSE